MEMFIYFDCSDELTDTYICQNSSIVHFKYVQCIVCQLYFNKAVTKDKY